MAHLNSCVKKMCTPHLGDEAEVPLGELPPEGGPLGGSEGGVEGSEAPQQHQLVAQGGHGVLRATVAAHVGALALARLPAAPRVQRHTRLVPPRHHLPKRPYSLTLV